MTFRTTLIALSSALAFGAVALSTAAQAYPARSESSVNVRSGPGTQYDVVGQLDPGERVNVTGSSGGWSHINGGWVSSNYLTASANYAAPPAYDYYDSPSYYDGYAGPPVSFGLSFGTGYGWGGHGWHGGGHHNWHH